MPSVILAPEYSLDGGGAWMAWTDHLPLGTLETGNVITVLLRGIVAASASGTITNTATATSTTPDPDLSDNTSSIDTVVEAAADLAIVKLGSPEQVTSGDLLTYTVVVANAGPSDAKDVTLRDDVPAGLLNAEFSTDDGSTWAAWTSPHDIGTLISGAAVTMLIRGTVSASATGSIVNTAIVDSTTTDPDPTDNTSTETTPVDTSADLAITKMGDTNPVLAGDVLTYTIQAVNNGPSDALNVRIADNVPANLTGVQYSADGGTVWNIWNGFYTLGMLANGGSYTLLLRGTVNPSATGVISNTAIIISTTPDPDPTNNSGTENTPVNTSADLAVTKSASPEVAATGQLLTYTVTVENLGPNDAQNTVITDTLPDSLSGGEYSTDGGAAWQAWSGSHSLGTLALGGRQQILIRGTVNPNSDLVGNTATVSSTTPDPDMSNNSDSTLTPVNSAANLSLRKTASPNPVNAGEQLTYTLLVTNQGPDTAQNVVLADDIPAALNEPQVSLDGVSWSTWQTPYALGNLTAGAAITVLVRGMVDPAAIDSLRNTAAVNSDTPDPDPEDNTDTEDTPVTPSADLLIAKQGLPNPAIPGETVDFTLTVTNRGPSDAQNVTVVDAVPSVLSGVMVSLDGGAVWEAWEDNARSFGALAAGASQTLLLRGLLNEAATGTLFNTAVAESTTPDPDLSNNTDTDSLPIQPLADIAIIKTASPVPVRTGETVLFQMVISNAGPSAAENVTLSDNLPDNLLNAEFSPDAGITWQPWNGAYPLGDLPGGSAVTVLIRATVAMSTAGTIANTASVDSDTPDPDPTDNTAEVEVPVAASADLAVQKTADAERAIPGQVLTYSITVQNNGPSDAENVTITDAPPAGMQNIDFSADNGVTWSAWASPYQIGTLTMGASVNVLLRGTVLSGYEFLTNTAIAGSNTPDPDPTNNTSTVVTPARPSADLAVIKTAEPNPAVAGELLTYTISMINYGPDQARNVILTDAAPDLLLDPQFSVDGGAEWSAWDSSYSIGIMESGATQTILLRGRLSASATNVANTAAVGSSTPDPDPANNTSTVVTPVKVSADLAVTKTASHGVIAVGERLTYTLTVSNYGPDAAQNVILTDVMPGVLSFPEYSTDGGAAWNTWYSAPYTIGTLEADGSQTILIRGVLDSPVTTLENTAVVSSSTPDPNPDNNVATSRTPGQIVPPVPQADLSVVKTVCPNPVTACGMVTYTIVAGNAGPDNASGAILTDDIPASVHYAEYSMDNGISWNDWIGSLQWDTLAAGSAVTVLIKGYVDGCASGSIVNTAIISSQTADPNPNNNQFTATAQIWPSCGCCHPGHCRKTMSHCDQNRDAGGYPQNWCL